MEAHKSFKKRRWSGKLNARFINRRSRFLSPNHWNFSLLSMYKMYSKTELPRSGDLTRDVALLGITPLSKNKRFRQRNNPLLPNFLLTFWIEGIKGKIILFDWKIKIKLNFVNFNILYKEFLQLIKFLLLNCNEFFTYQSEKI